MKPGMSEQIAELQIVLMDQQQTMEAFSAQLVGFGERLARLEQNVERVGDKVQALADLAPEETGVDGQRPPHY